MDGWIREPGRDVPVVAGYDVAVAGGGIAGSAAALAAARMGLRVCLIEKGCMPGGLATTGLVAIYLPLCDGQGRQVIAGLGEALLHASLRLGPGKIPDAWLPGGTVEARKKSRYEVEFHPAAFALSLEEMLLDAGVTLMYDTLICAVDRSDCDRGIKALVVENKGGRSAVSAKVFIDATGDADVCHLAGEDTVTMATNRRSGWFYSFSESRLKLHMLSDPLKGEIPPDSRLYDGVNPEDVTAQLVAAHARMREQMVRERETVDSSAYPAILPGMPNFRMTRRLRGVFELDETDAFRSFGDAIGMTGDWRQSGPVFELPYRCLTAVRNVNLLAAGRCISVTESAWDITRAIPSCAVTGEAAGTAAAMMVRDGVETAGAIDIGSLRRTLLDQGVLIGQ